MEKYDKNKVNEIQRLQAECSLEIERTKENIAMNEISVRNFKKRSDKEALLLKLRQETWEKQIRDSCASIDNYHTKLDLLLQEKDELHKSLKEALHAGDAVCQYCNGFYTQKSIARHENVCTSKPALQDLEKSDVDLKKSKKDALLLKKKKEELELALKELEAGD